MANLKGGTFEKQLKDIHHRLTAFGESRHNRTDNKTHSSALSQKRSEISRSFAKYCEDQGLTGKLNELMTNDNIKNFLDDRTQDFAASTIENYSRAFSSMISGLQQSNIDVPCDKSIFDDMVAQAKEMPSIEQVEGRAIDNAEQVIEALYEQRFESGVIADVQLELGLRISEAFELVSNPDKYINEADNLVEGIVGKGNHVYNDKEISDELISKIKAVNELPSQRTYNNDLNVHNITSHDFRYSYARDEVEKRLAQGYSYKEVLKSVSEDLNHSRESMTEYYLRRS